MSQAPVFNPLSVDDKRQIRSFVLRGGRVTSAQKRALESLWPLWGLDQSQLASPASLFQPPRELILDIGFGNGESLVHMAQQQGDYGFVGIEVYPPGIGSALLKIERCELTNVRLLCADASEALLLLPAASVAGVRLYFPDPWPKKRHHKRRIVQPAFVSEVARVLATGGLLHMATDWQPYAEHMTETLEPFHAQLRNCAPSPPFSERPDWRPQTKFERRGVKLGHGVYDLIYQKQPGQGT